MSQTQHTDALGRAVGFHPSLVLAALLPSPDPIEADGGPHELAVPA